MQINQVRITVEIDTEDGVLEVVSEIDGLVVSQAAVPRRYLLNHFNGLLLAIEQEVKKREGVGG